MSVFGFGGAFVRVAQARRVLFPFLDLNSLKDTGPKGHRSSASVVPQRMLEGRTTTWT